MRYAGIDKCECINGKEWGVTFYTQGCHHRCNGCFSPQTWDFNGGYEYTQETEDKIIELCGQPHISRFTLCGGDPLAYENDKEILKLLKRIKRELPHIKIWCWTGYLFEDLKEDLHAVDILKNIDVLVDGRFILKQKDITLAFRGSRNQRIIDVPQSLKKGRYIAKKVLN